VAMPSLYAEVRDDLVSIVFNVFGTQRSEQLLQRQRCRIGILVEVVHVHCAPRSRSLLHLKSVDGHPGIVRGRPRFDGWRRNVPRGCTPMGIGRGIYLRGRDSFGRSLRG